MDKHKELDQFYTNPHESDHFVRMSKKIFEKLGYGKIHWLEPSAGSGNFILSVKKIYKNISYTAFDLDPQNNDLHINKKNYLEVKENNIKKSKDKELIVLGNPPFGKRAKLAIDFFNHSTNFTDTIAMVFPLQFRKWSVQSKLNEEFELIRDWDIPKGSFLVNNREYDVNTCFQIWTRKKNNFKNLRILYKPDISHPDFEAFIHNNTKQTEKFFDKKEYKWAFAVHRQGYYDYDQRITNELFVREHPNRQWIFIKPRNLEIRRRLEEIDYKKLSRMNTTIPGFGKADLIKEYKDKYGK